MMMRRRKSAVTTPLLFPELKDFLKSFGLYTKLLASNSGSDWPEWTKKSDRPYPAYLHAPPTVNRMPNQFSDEALAKLAPVKMADDYGLLD
jgi:hypothetical protein